MLYSLILLVSGSIGLELGYSEASNPSGFQVKSKESHVLRDQFDSGIGVRG